MINIKAPDGLSRRIDAIINADRANTKLLERELAQVVWEGNRIDRMEGLDARGQSLPPVKTRTGRYAGATGKPMVPFNEISRAIAAFYARIVGSIRGGFRLVAGYQGEGVEILAYHAEGKAGNGKKGGTTGVVRDVFGYSDRTRQSVIASVRDFAGRTIAGKIGRGIRAFRKEHFRTFGVGVFDGFRRR